MSDATLSQSLLWGGLTGYVVGLVVRKTGRLAFYVGGTCIVGAAVYNVLLDASKTRPPAPAQTPPAPLIDDATLTALSHEIDVLTSNTDVASLFQARATPAAISFFIALGVGLTSG